MSDQFGRRQFFKLFGAAASLAVYPAGAQAQPTGKIHRIGFLWDGPDVFPDALEAFRQGLRDLGYIEGQSIAIEYRWAHGKPDHMRELAESWSGSRSM